MEDVSRYVSIGYLVAGIILAWLFTKTAGWILGGFGPTADAILFADFRTSGVLGVVLAVGTVTALYKNKRMFQLSNEVAVELSKVTWPEMDETKKSTIVVIIFSIILSLTLFMFDFIWKFVTDAVLSV